MVAIFLNTNFKLFINKYKPNDKQKKVKLMDIVLYFNTLVLFRNLLNCFCLVQHNVYLLKFECARVWKLSSFWYSTMKSGMMASCLQQFSRRTVIIMSESYCNCSVSNPFLTIFLQKSSTKFVMCAVITFWYLQDLTAVDFNFCCSWENIVR